MAQAQAQTQSQGHGHRIAVVGTLSSVILGFRGELIKTMVQAGHSVFAFAIDYTDESRAAVKALGATPVSYRLGRFSLNPLADLISAVRLYRLFRQYQITMSFCYFAKPVIYGTLAAWAAKIPVRVAKIEGLGRAFTIAPGGDTLKRQLVQQVQVALYRLSLRRAHHVFLLNPDDRKDLIDRFSIATGQVHQLNGIGVNLAQYRYSEPPQQLVRFIFVGRLLEEKGIRYFLAAAEQIKRLHPQTEFVVLGEPDGKQGVSRTQLMAYVQRGIITYPGRVDNVVPYLQAASVFVLPSYYREGVPRSTQEAMAVGRAIITTDMPGCRETVEQGVNGFLIPAHSQSALQQAMLQFIEQPRLTVSMGLESYRLAQQKFDVSKINKQIMEALQLQH